MELILSDGQLAEDVVNLDNVAVAAHDCFPGAVQILAVAVFEHHLGIAENFRLAQLWLRAIVDRSLEGRIIDIGITANLTALKFNEENHVVRFGVAHDNVVLVDDSEHDQAIAVSGFRVNVLIDVEIGEAQINNQIVDLFCFEVFDLAFDNLNWKALWLHLGQVELELLVFLLRILVLLIEGEDIALPIEVGLILNRPLDVCKRILRADNYVLVLRCSQD